MPRGFICENNYGTCQLTAINWGVGCFGNTPRGRGKILDFKKVDGWLKRGDINLKCGRVSYFLT